MLTKKQRQALDFIRQYRTKKKYAPSLEEIKKRLGLSSVSTAHHHVKKLQEAGYVYKEHNQPRGISPVEEARTIKIPLLGTITAGAPIEAIEIPGKTVTITQEDVGKSGNHYALRVEGESMIDEGIFDGDIVVIREQQVADNGQTVVAIIDDNEATLKKFYRESKRIRLQPANPRLFPIYRRNVEIRGVVVKIIRNLESPVEKEVAKNIKNNVRTTRVVKRESRQLDIKNLFPATLAQRKKNFLNKLVSPSGKTKYKRYTGAPIRYAGGKSLAVGLVVEHIPDSTKRIVSPFLGGGSVEVAIARELNLPVIGYDIFDILINYWDVQLKNPKTLYERLLKFKPTREEFKKVKERLKKHWKNKEKLGKLDLAAYYYFNHNTSYGPGFLSWPSYVYMNEKRYKSMIEKVRNFRADTLQVGCGSFEEILPKYKNDFLYCDPPYYLGSDSKMFRGIYPQRNFPIHHNGFNHEELRNLLIEHKGGFILSYNDCRRIREWYSDFEIQEVKWQYTMGQGETRIGLNRINGNRNHVKQSHEILIIKR